MLQKTSQLSHPNPSIPLTFCFNGSKGLCQKKETKKQKLAIKMNLQT